MYTVIITQFWNSIINQNIIEKRLLTQRRNLWLLHSNQKHSQFYLFSDEWNRQVDQVKVANVIKRFKRTKRENVDEESDDENEKIDSLEVIDKAQKGIKTLYIYMHSLRMDNVAKSALGVPRNTIDTAFYKDLLRVNGKKVTKKSSQVMIGDEIDLIQGKSPDNPRFLIVSRAEILDYESTEDNRMKVKVRRIKSLLIENYEQPWVEEDVEVS